MMSTLASALETIGFIALIVIVVNVSLVVLRHRATRGRDIYHATDHVTADQISRISSNGGR